MGDLPTQKQAQRLGDMKPLPPWGSYPWAIVYARADGILQTREEFIDSLDHEALAKWIYMFVLPVGAIPWKRLSQQRQEAFVKAMRDAIVVALGKETAISDLPPRKHECFRGIQREDAAGFSRWWCSFKWRRHAKKYHQHEQGTWR